ncbi:MAG TPA: Sec-independent protein translocase subunit TatA [Rhodanobacter sp.]|jgi:sec-independent protein translocase protein TatA|nr:Sec-independent protein translocase subunit TatA [Rhodanobacter sp.]
MSITHLVILLVVVVLIFGTKKLRNIGSDLGGAMRDFKKGLEGEDKPKDEQRLQADPPVANPAEQKQPDSTESK